MAVIITGNNTPTAGGITYGDGSTYANTAAGTSGQLLQSNGASAPTWVTASAGALTLISSATASNTALISFTGLTTAYRAYILEYDSVYHQNSGQSLALQFSTDNGSSYITSNYQRTVVYQTSATLVGNYSTTGDVLYLAGLTGLSTTSTQTANGILTIFAPAVSGKIANTYVQSNSINNSSLLENFFGAQTNTTTSAINAFKVFAQTGNIVSGNFRLYGLANA